MLKSLVPLRLSDAIALFSSDSACRIRKTLFTAACEAAAVTRRPQALASPVSQFAHTQELHVAQGQHLTRGSTHIAL
jgi:hypothetical protein